MNPLLTACTRLECDPDQRSRVCQAAVACSTWDTLAQEAEENGLGPLLFRHLRDSGAPCPAPVRAQLRLLYLRHRDANRIRMALLSEILAACDTVGIEVIVLKGAALAQFLYAEPGLRPMRDLDLLVKSADTGRMRQLLLDMGFRAPDQTPRERRFCHQLPEAHLRREGLLMSVEVHYDVFTWAHPEHLSWHQAARPLRVFPAGDRQALALGNEQMLWHLCHHLVTLGQPLRLIAVADILGLSERYCDEIDWDRMRRRYPFVLNTLGLLHLLAPLAQSVYERIGLSTPDGIRDTGREYRGWPHTPFARARSRPGGLQRLLRDSLTPPEWWLRLHYGAGGRLSALGCRCFTHPGRLGRLGIQWLLGRHP